MGAYHTSEVRVGQKITVGKRCWDDVFIRACDASCKADLAAVVMHINGPQALAHMARLRRHVVCIITSSMTVLKQKIDVPVPRKRRLKRDSNKEAKELLQSRPKWCLAQCSSGHMHAIKEVIADPAHKARLSDTKAHAEVRVMEEFLQLLKDDEDRVVYGQLPVFKAAEKGAIRKLM
eukprot:gene21982-18501_t